MASYFDPQPGLNSTAEAVRKEGSEDAKMILTPQVSRILEDFDLSSSSGEEGDVESDEEDGVMHGTGKNPSEEGRIAALHGPQAHSKNEAQNVLDEKKKHIRGAPSPQRLGTGREKHPHMARFHSLRSILFSTRLEDAKAQCNGEKEDDLRHQAMRPKTPEKGSITPEKSSKTPEKSPTRDKFVTRLGNTLKRMTSKELHTFSSREDKGHESTASEDHEPIDKPRVLQKEKEDEDADSDVESLGGSDVDDLIRWVSRKDPPSDGEARKKTRKKTTPSKSKAKTKPKLAKQLESGNESIGHSDVDELVRWVSRKDEANDESSESENPKELRRWFTQHDDTSGESLHEGDHGSDKSTASDSEGPKNRSATKGSAAKGSLAPDDVDEFVKWVTSKDKPRKESTGDLKEGEAALYPESGGYPEADGNVDGIENKTRSLTPEDVNELVKWMSRRERPAQYSIPSQTTEKVGDSGVEDDVSVSSSDGKEDGGGSENEDVDDLVRWVNRKEKSSTNSDKENSLTTISESDGEVSGRRGKEDSLAGDDVDELLRWVSRKERGSGESDKEIGLTTIAEPDGEVRGRTSRRESSD